MTISISRLGEAMTMLRESRMQRMEPEFFNMLHRDPVYQRLKRRAADAALRRSRLGEVGTRQQIQRANAAWARIAEAQDNREKFLRDLCKDGWVVICLGSVIREQVRAGLVLRTQDDAERAAQRLNGAMQPGDHGGYVAMRWSDALVAGKHQVAIPQRPNQEA